jgi:hypothetical protein
MADEPLNQDQIAMIKSWAEWSANAEECPVCHVHAEPVPAAGGRHVVAIAHEAGCPLAED